MANKKVTEPTHTQTEVVTKANGKMENKKVEEPTHTQMAPKRKAN